MPLLNNAYRPVWPRRALEAAQAERESREAEQNRLVECGNRGESHG
jgi:hypothetical protein